MVLPKTNLLFCDVRLRLEICRVEVIFEANKNRLNALEKEKTNSFSVKSKIFALEIVLILPEINWKHGFTQLFMWRQI